MIEIIAKKLAPKYNLDPEVVEKIIRSEFGFVANTIEEGEFESVHLHFLGKFAVKPNTLLKMQLWNKSKDT